MVLDDCNFCPRCGGKLINKFLELENHERLVCEKCDFIFYFNPIPAVGVILFNDDKICLVRRKYAPGIGLWCLPAGFVEIYETVEAAAVREAKEETNLDIEIERLHGVYSSFNPTKTHVVVIFYHAKIIGGEPLAGDDAEELQFFPLDEVPYPLAFDSHDQVIKELRQLRI